MSQYQPNAAPSRSFIEKINSKFSSLSVSSSLHHHTDKDGSSEDDTLIHKAFVNFYESRGEPFPEWLGVKRKSSRGNKHGTSAKSSQTQVSLANSNSQFQPVRASYNSLDLEPKNNSPAPVLGGYSRQNSVLESEGGEKSYTRRTNSKLQEMYNKSRQQSVAASAYSMLSQQSHYSSHSQPSPAARTNSSASGNRIRERVMNGSSFSGDSSARPSWGK